MNEKVRNRIAAYTIIILIGIIFLLIAYFNKDGFMYDLLMDMGASLLISTLVFFILSMYTFPTDNNSNKTFDTKKEDSPEKAKYRGYFNENDEAPTSNKVIRNSDDFGGMRKK